MLVDRLVDVEALHNLWMKMGKTAKLL